jgi:hypothetical protein
MTKRNNLEETIRRRVQEWHAHRAAVCQGATMETPTAALKPSSMLGTGTVGSPMADRGTAPGPEDDERWPPEPWRRVYTQGVTLMGGVPRLTVEAKHFAANAALNRPLRKALRGLPLEDCPAD